MCKIMEDLIDNEKKESAIRLLANGKLSNEEIAEVFLFKRNPEDCV